MAHKSRKRQNRLTEAEQFLELMTTAYVLQAAGLLDPMMERKLESLDELGAGNWKACVRDSVGFDAALVKRLYAVCTEYVGEQEALMFLLRGFSCSNAEELLVEFGVRP